MWPALMMRSCREGKSERKKTGVNLRRRNLHNVWWDLFGWTKWGQVVFHSLTIHSEFSKKTVGTV